ncbi:MAG: Holliday junction branch migration protein RuvA [Acidimicrobiaceae bacterium]|nr:Holliday junction branch migration protein RuvA [Acidimicrobiaceae bacterium]
MIGSLRGVVDSLSPPNSLIIDVSGVGYLVHCPTDLLARVSGGEEMKLAISTSVREDAITLYGFETIQDKIWFEALRTTQGVGPSMALGILSSLSRSELVQAISTNDVALLKRVPGVGPKTALRLIVEMQGRLAHLVGDGSFIGTSGSVNGSVVSDLKLGLISLGYSHDQIRGVVDKVPPELSLEEMLRYCLKELSA